MTKPRTLRSFITSLKAGLIPGGPFVIAEAGVNHEGSLDLAFRLVEEAKEGGADAIKFQTYKAATLASRNSPAYWDTTKEPTRSQYELFRKYDAFWKNEFEAIKRRCDEVGIEFLSTPFDLESASFLDGLMDVYKISSSDITNRPFIEHICRFGKPVILSTGASYLHEIEEAMLWIEASGVPASLMHCVLNYPTRDSDANLGMIVHLREKFPRHTIGYSDHTLPGDMRNLEVAYLLGAAVLEKHFTFDKTLPGNDHYHAMDKEDLKAFRASMQRIETLVGSLRKAPLAGEELARRNARRSLVLARPVAKGARITAEDLTWKRPGTGISPRDYPEVLGRESRMDLVEDTVLDWSMLK